MHNVLYTLKCVHVCVFRLQIWTEGNRGSTLKTIKHYKVNIVKITSRSSKVKLASNSMETLLARWGTTLWIRNERTVVPCRFHGFWHHRFRICLLLPRGWNEIGESGDGHPCRHGLGERNRLVEFQEQIVCELVMENQESEHWKRDRNLSGKTNQTNYSILKY